MNYLKYFGGQGDIRYLFVKIKSRIWGKLVSKIRKERIYPYVYKSYWNAMLSKKNNVVDQSYYYFTARPNPGAGIGHQISNWIAGYWWAKEFNIKFVHSPFSTSQWDKFLGFGEGEITVDELVEQGYKRVRLPLFGELRQKEIERTRFIFQSYSSKKIIFICEQDQGYMEQYGVMKDIQRKFYASPSRFEDKLLYSSDFYNIAIHVRRGDIVTGQLSENPNLRMRWQNNDYFTSVLFNVLKAIETEKPIVIYLFSQGVESDFEDFKQFSNLHFCLESSAQDSFLHMVNADLLITSKSSFSYKPALLNKGVKVCPKNFWHAYPESYDWILADENGNFEGKILN